MIEANGLTKTYAGGVEALKSVDLQVEAGEVFGLLGPNGAGKSTTVGILTTTILPTAGSARLDGLDVVEDALDVRRASSVVFQEPVVDRTLTGRRNLEIHARLWRVDRAAAEDRIEELAAALGLTELLERPVGGYSGGERRRLEIARGLVSRPKVLFLDEPTVGLDPRIRHELIDVIAAVRARDETTILLTTHYLEEAQRLCDRVAILHAGEIVATGTPGALLDALGRELLEIRLRGDAASGLAHLRSSGIAGGDAFAIGSTITVPLHERAPADALAAIGEAGLSTVSVATREPTLDDVYLRLTGGRLAEAA